jgi:hypothetical protein
MINVNVYEWYELIPATTIPKVDREHHNPIVYISPEIKGKFYIAIGDEKDAIEEIIFADIIFDCGSTCPTMFVIWEKKIYYANEKRIWYPNHSDLN